MRIPTLVIGGGLSGLAAAIRIARFTPDVVLLEKHNRLGGLNSYFYRNKTLFETGLHAITNFADPKDKSAPLNRLFRQLKLRRRDIPLCQQRQSKIIFNNRESLQFSNDFNVFEMEVATKFPLAADKFQKLLTFLREFDPFVPKQFISAKTFLLELLGDRLLVDMILCPLMYYGSSHEEDMDLSQFAIMFQAIFLEGMFRPEGTIKNFLDLLAGHLEGFGGKIRTKCNVTRLIRDGDHWVARLQSGEEIESDYILSTIGYHETLNLIKPSDRPKQDESVRLGFIETIYQLGDAKDLNLPADTTIIFYNDSDRFCYRSPSDYVDLSSGVVCFPTHFQGFNSPERMEFRTTHLACYDRWKKLSIHRESYDSMKKKIAAESLQRAELFLGQIRQNITFQNTFTPVTIERYTAKIKGAIYGNPTKIKDGVIGYNNLYLAGTDQGFLGIVGSMLSGVSIVNQHILPKL